MSNLQPKGSKILLSILSGPDKGKSYQVEGHSITMGRGSNNNIPINDRTISRQHIRIHISKEAVIVENMSKNKSIVYDGKKIERLQISGSDIISLGRTSLRISLPNAQGNFLTTHQTRSPAAANHLPTASRGLSAKHYRIGAIVVLIFVVLISLTDEEQKPVAVREVATINADDLIAATEEDMKKDKKTKRNKKAYGIYVKGFRDYHHQRFQDSIISFESCLSIDPYHELCTKYLRLSREKLERLIQNHIRMGQNYLAKNQYGQCISSFKNAMYMINDIESGDYKKSRRALKVCVKKEERRF